MSVEARQHRKTHFSSLLGSMGKILKCYITLYVCIKGCNENFLTLAQMNFLRYQLIIFCYVLDSQYELGFQVHLGHSVLFVKCLQAERGGDFRKC